MLLDAVQIAVGAHGDQRYGDRPYIVHPLAVAGQVAARGGTVVQTVAAVLHDTVEDTDLTVAEINACFGAEVAGLVDALTHHPDVTYEAYVEALPAEAVLVKLCDSICNLDGLEAAPMDEAKKARLSARYRRNIEVLSNRHRGAPRPTP